MARSGKRQRRASESRDEGASPPVDHARSALMRSVRVRDTGAELAVRRLLHGDGYRYRLHAGDLPGKPDIVFRQRRKVIFVHGCFWHRHNGCRRASMPKTRVEFWSEKFDRNRRRDNQVQRALTDMGWKFLVVWECQVKRRGELLKRLRNFLEET